MRLSDKGMLIGTTLIVAIGFFLVSSDNNQASEKDMISTAIDYYIENQNDTAFQSDGDNGIVTVKYKIFADRAEFLEHYPDCCRFSYRASEGYLPNAFDRWWYSYAGVVLIQAGWRQIDGDEIIEVPFIGPKGVFFDTSGNIIHALPKDPRF
jgi:hypothetical protein